MIPNVYHFVFGLREQTEPFHLLHYLCLASCIEVNRPEKVVVHCLNEPWGPLWDRIRPRIDVVRVTRQQVTEPFDYVDPAMETYRYAHAADFLRLRILLEHGGIYADMDTLFVAPLPAELRDAPCVMGHERVDVDAASAPEGSLCNAVVMAEPGSPFVRTWLDRMATAFDGSWSNHSTFLPFRLAREFPDRIRVEPESRFFALDWTRSGLADLFERDVPLPPDAVSLHLWAHLWWDVERRDRSDFCAARLTPAWVAHASTTYARLARRFLPDDLPPSALRHAAEETIWRAALGLGAGRFGRLTRTMVGLR